MDGQVCTKPAGEYASFQKPLRLDTVSFSQVSWETIDHVSPNLNNYARIHMYIVPYSEPMV